MSSLATVVRYDRLDVCPDDNARNLTLVQLAALEERWAFGTISS
jgi:hypothetical protein